MMHGARDFVHITMALLTTLKICSHYKLIYSYYSQRNYILDIIYIMRIDDMSIFSSSVKGDCT